MWENLSYADLQQAKEQLKLRRDEILRRQADELKGLDTEQAEIESLHRLVLSFAGKFKRGAGAASAAAIAPELTEPLPAPQAAAPSAVPQITETVAAPTETMSAPISEAPELQAPETEAPVSQASASQTTGEASPAPAQTAVPAQQQTTAPRGGRGRQQDERGDYGHTNFDVFNRALSKTL